MIYYIVNMDIFVCVNLFLRKATILTSNDSCSFHAQQIVVTINNVWALFLHDDKFRARLLVHLKREY